MKYKFIFSTLVVILVVASSCLPKSNNSNHRETIEHNGENISTGNATNSPSISTFTPRPMPETTEKTRGYYLYTPTVKNQLLQTSTPTISTPNPTFDSTQALYWSEKFFSDQLCKLPCMGNMVPGLTNWNDAKPFIERFARVNDKGLENAGYSDEYGVAISFPYPIPGTVFEPRSAIVFIKTHGSEKGIIQEIVTNRYNYSVTDLLSTYGVPSEIKIALTWDPFTSIDSESMWFDMVLFYSSQGFAAIFRGYMKYDQNIEVCPGKIEKPNPTIYLWPPIDNIGFSGLTKLKNWYYGDKFDPIKEVIGIDTYEFSQIYDKPTNKNVCLTAPNPLH